MGSPRGPGAIVLFGSGETSAVGSTALEWLRRAGHTSGRIAVLEAPAAFEPNGKAVARRWTESLRRRCEGAEVEQIPERPRDAPTVRNARELDAVLSADLLALGAGSPTYTVRRLAGTPLLDAAIAAHARGASFFLASAAAIASGTFCLPVYEIYKVGDDLHWKGGLGLFERYGLTLAVMTHFDNKDGGAALDTSRCFMGETRFGELLALLPDHATVVGVDEHTALALDPRASAAEVLGRGGATVVRGTERRTFPSGSTFPLTTLGPFTTPAPTDAEPSGRATAARTARAGRAPVPPAIALLVATREKARAAGDFATADRLREQLAARGWRVEDAASGSRVLPVSGRDQGAS